MTGILKNRQRCLEGVLERRIMFFRRFAQVGTPAAEYRLVRFPHRRGRLDERVVQVSMFPVQLIDTPRGDRRLGEFANLRGVLSCGLRESVSRGGELRQRQLIQLIDFRFETTWRHQQVSGSPRHGMSGGTLPQTWRAPRPLRFKSGAIGRAP